MKIDTIVKKSASEDQLLHYKAKSKQLEKQVTKLLKDRGSYKALMKEFIDAIPALDPLPMAPLIPSEKPASTTKIAAVVKLSDWQIGEVIDPRETDGFGHFNFATAERRVGILEKKVIDWVSMHRKAGFVIPELHVFSEADLVSGNIHYELEVTNEFPVTIASLKAGQLLARAIGRWAPFFEKVVVWEMSADNHGRLTRKNQGKQGAKNNYSRIAHEHANALLVNYKNVYPVLSESSKLLATVMGKRFLIAHGHGILSTLGIPYYGLERDRAREAVKRMNTKKKFDYISIGHYHVASIVSGNILINGNLPGTTEFDHAQGRHAAPSQVSFMVHPVHGIFDWTSWKLR